MSERLTRTGISRRRLLASAGAGAVAIGAGGTLGTLLGPSPASAASDRFGRMFPSLPSFAPATSQVRAALLDISKVGGITDAKDPMSQGAEALAENQALSINNPDNFSIPAGMTYFGQFVDHDLTFDTSSPLGTPVDPGTIVNGRTAALDLDSLYGAGPTGSPQLYNAADPVKLKIESGGRFEDLPRNANGTAIVGDVRNDENLVIGGITAAFIIFHNRVVDRLRSQGVPAGQVFAQARQLVTWHYQWIVLNEFLPLIAGPGTVSSVLTGGRRYYTPTQAFIPVEFSAAAYRFGHTQPRPAYLVNRTGNNGDEFYAFLFDASLGGSDPADLRGGVRSARRYLDWQFFFQFFDGQVHWSKWIDVRNSTPIFSFPLPPLPPGSPSANLIGRDLLRQLTFSIPSGQRIAAAIGAPALGSFQFSELAGYGLGLDSSTPLFYYILKEAQVMAGGQMLGPVGARIVAEVLIGLCQLDSAAYLKAQPSWKPTLPSRFPGQFTMADLLTFAQVDPSHR